MTLLCSLCNLLRYWFKPTCTIAHVACLCCYLVLTTGTTGTTGTSRSLSSLNVNLEEGGNGNVELCDHKDIFNGRWVYHGTLHNASTSIANSSMGIQSAYRSCPNTLNLILSTSLKDHPEKYGCTNYLESHFEPSSCQMVALKNSLLQFNEYGMLRPDRSQLVFVGDSVMGQMYIAIQCFAEEHGINASSIHFQSDLFLRNDIPCHDQCLTNETFRTQTDFFHPCWACRDGIRRNFSDYEADPDSWYRRLPANTGFLVMSVGTWYNGFHGLINSTATYIETLDKVAKLLHKFEHQFSGRVLWVDLPPVLQLMKLGRFPQRPDYEWSIFSEKNGIARDILERNSVRFLNSSTALGVRISRDPNVNADGGIHWCNPGKFAMPTYLNHVFFHLLMFEHHLAGS